MGNIGDSISDSAPAVGTSGPGYATTINSLLTELKARLISRIPLSSLLTNDDLDLNGQALLNAAYVTLTNEAVSPVASPVNRLAAFSGNLWWISPSGALQISNGANLNAAGIGGITGDYSGAGPMEFRYDTANTRYDAFANQSTNTWAYVRARGFDIAGGATSAFRLRHLYNGTANGQLTWTEPTASRFLYNNASNQIEFKEAVRSETEVYYDSQYKNISAIDLFTRGLFSGAGVAAIAVTDDVYRYNLSDGAGAVTFQVHLDSEAATDQTVPIQIGDIQWYGSTPGGYPTMEIWKIQGDAAIPNPAFTTNLREASPFTTTDSGTLGTTDKCVYTLDTPLTFKGDEVIYIRMTAGTANLDTYHIAVGYSKIT